MRPFRRLAPLAFFFAGILFLPTPCASGTAQEPGIPDHPPPGTDTCSWTVVSVGAKSLSAKDDCSKGPKVVFPVEGQALGQLKKLKPGYLVCLKFGGSASGRTVVSIEIKRATASPSGDSGTEGTRPSKPILYVRTDLPCAVSIDQKPRATLTAGGAVDITVEPGQHVVTAVGEKGQKSEQIVEPKGPRTVVDIKLEPLGTTDPPVFDQAAAMVWVALTDLRTAGAYAGTIAFGKSFGFHDPGLLAMVHKAHESVRQAVMAIGEKKPGDPFRKRVADDAKREGDEAKQYAELLAKAMTMAQDKNSAMGEPTNLFGQAKAIEGSLTFSAEVLEGLRGSQAFGDALPPDLRPRAGLPADPRDFRFGADYCQSEPLILAVLESGGLADKLGLAAGDQLVSAAGKPVKSVWELKLVLRENAGHSIPVAFMRKGKSKSIDARVPAALPH